MADKRSFSVIVSLGNRHALVRVQERKGGRDITICCVCVCGYKRGERERERERERESG